MEKRVNIPDDRYIRYEDFTQEALIRAIQTGNDDCRILSTELYEVNNIPVWQISEDGQKELITEKGFMSFSASHRFVQLCRLWTISCKDGSKYPITSDEKGNVYFTEPKSQSKWMINISDKRAFNEFSFLCSLSEAQNVKNGYLYSEVGRREADEPQVEFNFEKAKGSSMSLTEVNTIKKYFIEHLLMSNGDIKEQGNLSRILMAPYKVTLASHFWVFIADVKETVQANTISEKIVPVDRKHMAKVKRPASLFNEWLESFRDEQVLSATFAGRCECGTGKELCPKCKGTRMIDCPDCSGTGEKRCPGCGGGRKCSVCGGKGSYTEYYTERESYVEYLPAPDMYGGLDSEMRYRNVSKSRRVKCYACSGGGACEICNGSGRVDCERCNRYDYFQIRCENCDKNGEAVCSKCKGKLTFGNATTLSIRKKEVSRREIIDDPRTPQKDIRELLDYSEISRVPDEDDDFITVGKCVAKRRFDRIGDLSLSNVLYNLDAFERIELGTDNYRVIKQEITIYAKKLAAVTFTFKGENYIMTINEHSGKYFWGKA